MCKAHSKVTHMPNFTVVAYKMWAYSPPNHKKTVIVGINLPLRENSGVNRKS